MHITQHTQQIQQIARTQNRKYIYLILQIVLVAGEYNQNVGGRLSQQLLDPVLRLLKRALRDEEI